jgi:2-hydroxy-3-keto-5-methylthiopentenyl-1-phosphate phosphatase
MNTLVSDFDVTLTRNDFFDLVRQRWPFPPEDDPWEKYVAGEITHFEALARIFVRIRRSQASLLELVESMELETSLALLVPPERRFARGWLAEALRERGEGFHSFERWSQIADQLRNDAC